ncbi:glycosyltransferase family 4 protein [Paraoerskovia marina]|uniref:glycosyltransferase family 4 protein n=1 Tax=Paraoerskovia marina TaxID=545619 RepID=UPI0004922952|nr:glycosyltransferase family 4 protein [Paraoerskovia marina]
MRIVHVSDCLAPRTGGIESQVGDLAAAQAAAGDDVHVLTATPGAGGERGGVVESAGDVVVHRLGAQIPGDAPINPVTGPRLIRAALDELRPDVVHVHAGMISPFAYDGARIARERGLPMVVTWHCMLDGATTALALGARLSGWRDARFVPTAVSPAAGKRVARMLGVDPDEVGVVPNAIDVGAWSRGAAGREPSSTVRLVATQRLAPRKRGRALIDAMADATRVVPDGALHLTLVGDGPQEAALRARVEKLGLGDSVLFAGRLPREEIPVLYRHADFFCAPADLEAFGIAALEARAAGLGVLARRGTGIEGFVRHEEDGLLVDDDAGFAEAMVRLVRDRPLRDRIVEHNVANPPAHGWDATLAAATAAYTRARG